MKQDSTRLALCFVLLTWATAGSAASQDSAHVPPTKSKFPIDDMDPERSIPSPEEAARDPLQMGYLMMDITQRAEAAFADGQPARAAKYYRAIARAAPDRALPYRKACAAHQRAGEIAKAVEMCRGAVQRADATPDDRFNFLEVVLKKPGKPTPAEVRDIDATLARLGREFEKMATEKTRRGLAEVKCQVAARLGEPARLAACTQELRSLDASDAQLLPYAWALAISQGDVGNAERLKDEAIRKGLPVGTVEVMVRGLANVREKKDGSLLTLARRWWPALAAALALGAALMLQRRRRAAR
jgi:hypothetical protein